MTSPSSAGHYVGRQRDRGIFTTGVDTLGHYRVMRALIVVLQNWVVDGHRRRLALTRELPTAH
jgi:hypothetical protein